MDETDRGHDVLLTATRALGVSDVPGPEPVAESPNTEVSDHLVGSLTRVLLFPVTTTRHSDGRGRAVWFLKSGRFRSDRLPPTVPFGSLVTTTGSRGGGRGRVDLQSRFPELPTGF